MCVCGCEKWWLVSCVHVVCSVSDRLGSDSKRWQLLVFVHSLLLLLLLPSTVLYESFHRVLFLLGAHHSEPLPSLFVFLTS